MIDKILAEKLRFTLQSPGWQEFFQPMLEQERNRNATLLAMVEDERPSPKYTDDFLKGYVRAMIFVLSRPLQILHEFDYEETSSVPPEPQAVGDPYS